MLDFISKILKSKTIIVGVLTFTVGLLGYSQGHEFIAQYPEVVAIIVSVSGVLQVVLRFFTALPVSAKKALFSNDQD